MKDSTFNLIKEGLEAVTKGNIDKKSFLEYFIIPALAQEDTVIPIILKIIEQERKEKREIIVELNHELSRADTYLSNKALKKDIPIELENIKQLYKKYTGRYGVGHCYKNSK